MLMACCFSYQSPIKRSSNNASIFRRKISVEEGRVFPGGCDKYYKHPRLGFFRLRLVPCKHFQIAIQQSIYSCRYQNT